MITCYMPCENKALWCAAYLCARCDNTGTTEMCDRHYEDWIQSVSAGLLICPRCKGQVSFLARHITTGIEESHII